MDKVVETWNAAHPDIQVTVQQAGRRRRRGHQAPHRRQGGQPAGPGPGRVPGAAHAGGQQRRGRHRGRRRPGQGRVRRRRLEPGDPRHRRGLRHPAGQRPDDALLPQRPVREVRHRRSPTTWDEYAAAAREVRKKDAQDLPGHVLQQATRARSPGWRSRPAASGGRSSASTWKVNIADEPDHPEGRRLLGRAGQGGRRSTTSRLHPRVEQGAQRRQAARLAVRRLGARRAAGNAPSAGANGRSHRCRSGRPASGTTRHSGVVRPPRSRRSPPAQRPPPSSRPGSTPTQAALAMLVKEGAHLPRLGQAGRPALTEAPEYFSNQPDFWRRAADIARPPRRIHLRPRRQRHLQRVQGRLRQGAPEQVGLLRGGQDHAGRPRSPTCEDRHSSSRPTDASPHRRGARTRGTGAGARTSFLAPAVVLFALFMALPIGYTVYLSLRTHEGLRARARQGRTEGGLRRPGELRRRARRRRAVGRVGCACSATGRWSWSR